jgi:dinuclear metal center YbgI/SA1388 family protein
MPTVDSIIHHLEEFAPPALAAEWDNVGLLLGDSDSEVGKIMTCLTVTPESAAEAVSEGANLIVTHHPILFRPIQRLTTATSDGRVLLSLIRANVAVYCPHTAFDNTRDGINDLLAQRLILSDVRPLRPRNGEGQAKIVVFVPDSDLRAVSDALFAAGAGHIGHYSQCSFRLSGTGTFFGSDATNPTLGQKGRREEVAEWRLEAICPDKLVDAAIAAMRKAHSYEEPAYDVYPLRSGPSGPGDGRCGRLPTPLSLGALANQIKKSLSATVVQVVGDPARQVQTVAIVCGAGSEFISDAAAIGADVLLTGEARFHDYVAAQARGLSLLLPGHFATERPGVEDLAERIGRSFPDVRVWACRREADPVRAM